MARTPIDGTSARADPAPTVPRRIARAAGTFALVALVCAGLRPGLAETRLFSVALPEGRSISYSVELDVDHHGTLVVSAEWTAPRILSFRLDGPGGRVPPVRRSGPSPQRFTVDVDPATAAFTEPWVLSIMSLSQRGSGEGRVTVEFPEPVPIAPPVIEPLFDVEAATREPLVSLPAGSPASWKRYDRASRHYRETYDTDPGSDPCRWQADLRDFLEETRAGLAGTGKLPTPETRAALRELVGAIRRVEALRTSKEQILAGPPPAEEARRKAWLRVREARILDLEGELDDVLWTMEYERGAELQGESWPVRLVSCITACERHFEERVRIGAERATNLDIARSQWPRMLIVADSLKALASVEQLPGGRRRPDDSFAYD